MLIYSKNVEDYYIKHFNDLPKDKQFHFASRLFLFFKKKYYKKKLDELKDFYLWKSDKVFENINTALKNNIEYKNKIVNHRLFRKEVIDNYPLIGSFNHIIFKLIFHKTLYGEDFIKIFKKHPCVNEMKKYHKSLLNDPKAIFYLSTHAINFLFLLKEVLDDVKIKDLKNIVNISNNNHSLNKKDLFQSSIYLLTHIIIAESLFYSRSIKKNLVEYNYIFKKIEEIIDKNFSYISLDQKIEFLICGKILNKKSKLEKKILSEAEKSKSPNGDFIIDKLNKVNQPLKLKTFEGSEHRNVLYIILNHHKHL